MSAREGLHAFAFQTGDWRVLHKKRRNRLANDDEWYQFEGTCQAWELLGGAGNIDDHWIGDPEDPYPAATIRRLEPDGSWSIWWIDSRRSGLDAPMSGSFKDGVGTFFGDDEYHGKPIVVRFIWTPISANRARWEQAFSPDGRKSWETNWIMEFVRAP